MWQTAMSGQILHQKKPKYHANARSLGRMTTKAFDMRQHTAGNTLLQPVDRFKAHHVATIKQSTNRLESNFA